MVSESQEAVKWLQTNHKLLRYRCAFNPEIKCDYITSNTAYGREIEPMTDKTQWPQVELPFLVGASLAKLRVGRRRKLRSKGWMEGGHKKKGSKDGEGTNEGEGTNNGCDNATAPTNAKGKKMIRGPMTCKRCGEKGHWQASAKCPLGQKKEVSNYFLYQKLK